MCAMHIPHVVFLSSYGTIDIQQCGHCDGNANKTYSERWLV